MTRIKMPAAAAFAVGAVAVGGLVAAPSASAHAMARAYYDSAAACRAAPGTRKRPAFEPAVAAGRGSSPSESSLVLSYPAS
jgi:hypothetical protein